MIEIHTCSFRVTRGYTFAAVLADETAFWRDETSANPDVEIFRALRPGLANIPGAMLNASSPYRKAGVLHATFARHFGKGDAVYSHVRRFKQQAQKIPCLSFKLFSVAATGQSRRHDHETTVDHALIRGLVTAGPVIRRGASSV